MTGHAVRYTPDQPNESPVCRTRPLIEAYQVPLNGRRPEFERWPAAPDAGDGYRAGASGIPALSAVDIPVRRDLPDWPPAGQPPAHAIRLVPTDTTVGHASILVLPIV
jgi:hypothetical protein